MPWWLLLWIENSSKLPLHSHEKVAPLWETKSLSPWFQGIRVVTEFLPAWAWETTNLISFTSIKRRICKNNAGQMWNFKKMCLFIILCFWSPLQTRQTRRATFWSFWSIIQLTEGLPQRSSSEVFCNKRTKLALRPFGGSVVILMQFCRSWIGNLPRFAGYWRPFRPIASSFAAGSGFWQNISKLMRLWVEGWVLFIIFPLDVSITMQSKKWSNTWSTFSLNSNPVQQKMTHPKTTHTQNACHKAKELHRAIQATKGNKQKKTNIYTKPVPKPAKKTYKRNKQKQHTHIPQDQLKKKSTQSQQKSNKTTYYLKPRHKKKEVEWLGCRGGGHENPELLMRTLVEGLLNELLQIRQPMNAQMTSAA